MQKRLVFLGIGSVAFVILWLGLFLLWVSDVQTRTEVVFLNVGEGDAILISQGTNQIVIDGGRNGKELLGRLGRHVPFWDRQIETIIATHPDADHIGGFPSVFKSYRVGTVFTSGAESDTEASKLFQDVVEASLHAGPREIFRGASIQLPDGGELIIEYPERPLPKETKDTNGGSVVARFTYGETSFLLTGDLPHEETVLPNTEPVTVLKAAHHGSKYSTSEAFLDIVRPSEVVISVGKNMYGHPAVETLERLMKKNILIHRTDQEGDIVYVCKENKCALER